MNEVGCIINEMAHLFPLPKQGWIVTSGFTTAARLTATLA
jgi:hypothetical protein